MRATRETRRSSPDPTGADSCTPDFSSRSTGRPSVRPLRHGDVGTVMAVFERLSEPSRRVASTDPSHASARPSSSSSRGSTRRATCWWPTWRTTRGPSSCTARPRRTQRRDRLRGRRRIPQARHRVDPHRELPADARAAGIAEITASLERQLRRGRAAPPDPGRARHPLRGPRALDPRGARLTSGRWAHPVSATLLSRTC